MKKDIVIIGAGGHAISILDAVHSMDLSVVAFVDEAKKGEKLLGLNIYSNISDIKDFGSHEYVIGIGDNSLRKKVVKKSLGEYPDMNFATVIHKTSYVSNTSEVSTGSVILAKSFIGPCSNIGNHCIVNSGSIIDHECSLDDYSSTGPGAVLGGNVKIGSGSIISIGAIVKHGIRVGRNSLVGANSLINKNIDDNLVYYGVPAKEIRSRKSDEKYL